MNAHRTRIMPLTFEQGNAKEKAFWGARAEKMMDEHGIPPEEVR